MVLCIRVDGSVIVSKVDDSVIFPRWMVLCLYQGEWLCVSIKLGGSVFDTNTEPSRVIQTHNHSP